MRAEPSWTIGAGPPRIIGSKDPSDVALAVVVSTESLMPIDVAELLSGAALLRLTIHNEGRAKRVTSAMSTMRRRSNAERNNLFSPCLLCVYFVLRPPRSAECKGYAAMPGNATNAFLVVWLATSLTVTLRTFAKQAPTSTRYEG